MSSFDVDANGNALSAQQQKQLALQQAMLLNEEIAYEGFVLLKNTDNALPLTGQNVKISVFGKTPSIWCTADPVRAAATRRII